MLLGAYGSLEEQLGAEHPRTRQAAERIVELYERWGRPEEAAPFQQVLAVAGDGSR